MSVRYTVGCEVSGRSDNRFADGFDEWNEARQHLVTLFSAYYDDLLEGPPSEHSVTGAVLRSILSWPPGTLRSAAAVVTGPRFFLYPVIEEERERRLACPRCLLRVEATEVHHGVVAGGADNPVAFEETMRPAFRVYCEGDCEAESDENENLFDAIDGFFEAVTWPRGTLLLSSGEVEPLAP
jgi:hypothetical protein